MDSLSCSLRLAQGAIRKLLRFQQFCIILIKYFAFIVSTSIEYIGVIIFFVRGATAHTNNKCNNGYDRVHGSFKLLAVPFYLCKDLFKSIEQRKHLLVRKL